VHDVFQIPNLAGLSDGLKAETMRKMPIVEITPRLSVLPGGRPDRDPMSGLTSERMKRVIQQAAERFDWVILDTPPIAVMPDGNLVAALVDTVLLVIAAGRTPYAAVQRTIVALGRERIIGVVLNYVDGRAASALQYGYDRPSYPAGRVIAERA
jgi:Mrp family chromosome partitioning ATPase